MFLFMFWFTALPVLMLNHPHICQWLFTAAYKLMHVLYFVIFCAFVIREEHAFLCDSSLTRLARLLLGFVELALYFHGSKSLCNALWIMPLTPKVALARLPKCFLSLLIDSCRKSCQLKMLISETTYSRLWTAQYQPCHSRQWHPLNTPCILQGESSL